LIFDYGNLYKNIASLYHYTPQEISGLTYAQVEALMVSEKRYTAADIAAYTERRKNGQ
jgi:hypothetical protein